LLDNKIYADYCWLVPILFRIFENKKGGIFYRLITTIRVHCFGCFVTPASSSMADWLLTALNIIYALKANKILFLKQKKS
jgi:hypothetical protein